MPPVTVGPGITLGSGVSVDQFEYTGDLEILGGFANLETDVGPAVDLNI